MGQNLLIAFIIIFALNMTAYLWAFRKQTDHLTDLTYNLSFFLLAIILWFKGGDFGDLKNVLLAMVLLWSFRLGIYLFTRIKRIGSDERFDAFRESRKGFFKFWLLQSVSIWILSLPFIIVFSKGQIESGIVHMIGGGIWFLGWILESIADQQKAIFKKKEENKGKFIKIGLYKFLQYPNYTGEILCWIGIFIFCAPYLNGVEWLAIVSPLWIICLLVFISGIPLLEKSSQEKYGHLPEFSGYKSKTKKLIPFIY